MPALLYKQGSNFTNSTGSFLNSAPVEISTVKGYEDFLSTQTRRNGAADVQTVFNDDKSQGHVLKNGEVIATVTGAARDYLVGLLD